MSNLRCQRRFAALLFFFAIPAAPLFSQNVVADSFVASTTAPVAPAAITIEQYVREVSLVLSVTDHNGRFVGNLQPSDFSILDNDKKQDVLTFFQRETNLPLRVALLLDTSSSVAYKFPLEQSTIGEFFHEIARPPDRVAVFAFNQDVELVAPITNNWKQVSHSVRSLKADGETALYDAIAEGSAWLEQGRQPSRHIIILISDGQDNVSKNNIDDTISRVLTAEASIYAVNVADDFPIPIVKEGAANLKRLADATGGSYLHADDGGSVRRAFARIRRELRSQYALAYRPSNLTDQVFHQLRITVPDNLRVRCRTGYYTK